MFLTRSLKFASVFWIGFSFNLALALVPLETWQRQIDWLKGHQRPRWVTKGSIFSFPGLQQIFKAKEGFTRYVLRAFLYNKDTCFLCPDSLLFWNSGAGDNIYHVKCPQICTAFDSMTNLLFCHLTFASEFLFITKALDKDLIDLPHKSTVFWVKQAMVSHMFYEATHKLFNYSVS